MRCGAKLWQILRLLPSTRFVVDTSFWIRSILPNDSNNTAALNWLDNNLRNGVRLVSPLRLVAEIAGAVSRISGNVGLARAAVRNLYAFPLLELLPLDESLVAYAADVAIQFRLLGADSFYVAVARQLSIPLVTFDREQLTRPASIITTIKP